MREIMRWRGMGTVMRRDDEGVNENWKGARAVGRVMSTMEHSLVSVLLLVVVMLGLVGGILAQQGRGSSLLDDLEQDLLDQGWAPPPPRFHYRGFNRPIRKVH
ncbi:hypothetical protein Pcinc_025708 [Petrolisthes cinctipes]|uniref:Uncharacterized protein n=1 Tax=Petrolisthes cinctipes TaxID=88211 RepID=A0AAE1KDE8_PETCI|nr:hypothetical protein Pcinc_025708 [Petrolisthes cinctipes]